MTRTWPFMVCILGLALSGGALILCIPPLFGPGGGPNLWVLVVLGCLALVFAAGARLWKVHSPTSGDRR